MAIDPNLFLNPDAVGDFNDSTPNASGYGALSGAELNQTYFAYYDGCGRQDPELPKQTTFFIKYLIDTNGNVVKPQPNDTSVLNIINNFETGKPVIVTTKTPTVALNPLLGEKTVTHVGELSTLLVTNTGSGKMDYVSTINFQDTLGIALTEATAVPNFNMKVRAKSPGTPIGDTSYPGVMMTTGGNINQPQSFNQAVFNLLDTSTSPDWSWNTTHGRYIFNANTTSGGGSRVKFYISLNLRVWTFKLRGDDNYISKNGSNDPYHENAVYLQIQQPDGTVIWEGNQRIVNNRSSAQYIEWTSPYFNFNSGDYVTFHLYYTNGNLANRVIMFTDQQGGTSQIRVINENQNLSGEIDGVTVADAPYFEIGEYPDQNGDPNAVYTSTSVLTASYSLTNMYRAGLVQELSFPLISASYMQPWQPWYQLTPGDRIIFENDKNNVHTITEIIPFITASNNSSSFGLRVVPGIPTGSIINNFCIYRILNNGSQIMIDQEKPTGTAALAFRGFIRPKYISQELDTKFTEIINKLEADGIIE